MSRSSIQLNYIQIIVADTNLIHVDFKWVSLHSFLDNFIDGIGNYKLLGFLDPFGLPFDK